MPQRITCDNCRHVLRVPDHVTDLVLTCPRCLAKVVNADVVLRTAPPAGATPSPSAESAPGSASCPGCARRIETAWNYCPFCNAALQKQEAPPAPGIASPDADVQFDTRGTGLGLLILAVMAAAGLGLFYLGGGFDLVRGVPGGPAIGGIGVLFVLIALAAIALLRTPSQRTPAGVARGFMGGCAVTATVAVVLLALLCAAVVSAVLTFVQTCAEACGPPPQKAPAKK